jgi:hypothetical protein
MRHFIEQVPPPYKKGASPWPSGRHHLRATATWSSRKEAPVSDCQHSVHPNLGCRAGIGFVQGQCGCGTFWHTCLTAHLQALAIAFAQRPKRESSGGQRTFLWGGSPPGGANWQANSPGVSVLQKSRWLARSANYSFICARPSGGPRACPRAGGSALEREARESKTGASRAGSKS